MVNVNNFKNGITFEEDGKIFSVIEAQHSKQGRGQASVKAKVKDLRTGAIIMKTYTGGEKVNPARINKVEMNYLYNDGENFIFLDNATFEQIEIKNEKLEWESNFLSEGKNVIVRKYKDEVLDVSLPANVTLKVIEAPDAVKGNTQTKPQKKIKVETGYELDVPMFIKEGDKIIVSSETGKYKERTK
ncbi:MAG: elongation factor P [Mycoplasma sp.]|nr:elongation factor P [Mycoplasma sp.]